MRLVDKVRIGRGREKDEQRRTRAYRAYAMCVCHLLIGLAAVVAQQNDDGMLVHGLRFLHLSLCDRNDRHIGIGVDRGMD